MTPALRLAAAAAILATPGLAQIKIEPNIPLQVQQFSTLDYRIYNLPAQNDPTFGAFLYAANPTPAGQELWAFDALGNPSLVGISALDNAVITFGEGAFLGRLLACEKGGPVGGLAQDGIWELLPDATALPFNLMGGGNPDPNEAVYPGGAFGDLVYVANPSLGTTDPLFDLSITRMDPAGNLVGLFHSDPQGPFYMAASSGGPYGEALYYTTLSGNKVRKLLPDGSSSDFATLMNTGWDLEFGRGGAFGHSLYATDVGRFMYRIDAAGNVQQLMSGFRWFAFEATTGDLFARPTGAPGIWRVGSAPLASTETVRLGTPPNPAALLPGVSSGPVAGATWDPLVDHTGFAPSAVLDLLTVNTQATNLPMPEGTLLCDLLSTGLLTSALPGASFQVPVPADYFLVGLALYAQASALDPAGQFALTNGLDITIGTF